MKIEEAQKRILALEKELEELRAELIWTYSDSLSRCRLEIMDNGDVCISTYNKLGKTEKHVIVRGIAFAQFAEFYNGKK